ncbi:unnamed protein product [Penicillium pancosmium]
MPGAMTMVKSRTAPTEEAISFPVLTYSDAAPRSDLCDIDERAKHQENQQSLAQFEFPRPSSGDGRSRRKPPPGTVATFDFRVTAPPDEVVPSHAMLDRSPIGVGIALGSPGMVDSKDNLPPPRFNTSIFTEQQKGRPQQSQPLRKASKWKKIGGLFRAKSALASPTRPRPPPMTLPNHAAVIDKQTIQKAGTEEWPRIESDSKYSTTKTASTTPSRSRKFSLSNKKSPKESNGDLGPRLEIDIPDVQMERYSVMFSNVMNKNQRPSLLARRSKTLDSVQVPQNSNFLAAKVPPVPQRRATSPARSSFTLFPTSQPSKAAQVLGTQNFSRGPSPSLRSNTLPAESPSEASPMETPRPIPNNNSVSSFESLPIANVFQRSHTPRSSTASSRYDDKPLPAIKPEPETEPSSEETTASRVTQIMTQNPVARPSKPQSRSQSPAQAPAPAPRAQQIPRQRSSPLKNERSLQQENPRVNRPNLTIKTASTPLPKPPAKDLPVRSSSIPVPGQQIPKLITDQPSITMSPSPLSSGPMSAVSPQQSSQPARIPLSNGGKMVKTVGGKTPTIEVSTARSVSVSKGRRQMLVPIGSRADHLDSNERLVERKTLTPRITEVTSGHRPAKSQQLQIESL